ncbi:MAG: hypothetical protein LUC41_09140 [Clostridiales bacterium]|nr:hypothetical protein [Clostridiales bacterium]
MYKDYGLADQVIKVKLREPAQSLEHPWGNMEVNMRVVSEQPTYLSVEVLLHTNRQGAFGPSWPYPDTLHKHEIELGNIIINGGAIR